ncbi:MerR family transcriptional regulator [Metabacillus sp. GX 13764]|uniref:MerR family transcriptional regulator n=1 Tax=Metabacillus kandeliae TaxID=2900151 RepID=UPI001E50767A|nr:MerR family transcriptional regulator [Metabacillus kandeliae]MCD7034684.1 MerR family transcriptional regulator [Metabacillus kandeliae]
MNTSMAAKQLGVSSKTIQRWVKQLDLPMERNELGHYLFEDKDIETLKDVKKQLTSGILLQDISIEKKPAVRKGAASLAQPQPQPDGMAEIMDRLKSLEKKMNDKADAVVSYQLLQHRREMDELSGRMKQIEETLEKLTALAESRKEENYHEIQPQKKSFLKAMFSL